jgi:two-component sensor histidine kinase
VPDLPPHHIDTTTLLEAVDWSATPLGPREGWSPSLQLAMGIVLSSGLPMALRWGPEFVMIYNDAYRHILGDKHPWAFGRSAREVWPEVWSEIGPAHDAILAGRSGPLFFENRSLLVTRGAAGSETAQFTFSYSPVPDATMPAGVGGVLVSGIETTERLQAQARMEAAEAKARATADRLAAVLESTGDCVFVLDQEWRFSFLNTRARQEIAHGRDLLGGNIWDEFPHAVGTVFGDNYQRVMTERVPATFEAYYPPPLATWYEVNAYPSEEGIAVFFRNINERHAAQERQSLLIRELHHRVRNTLATVQAIFSLTVRSATSLSQFSDAFTARISSLAKTHLILTEDEQQVASLHDLLRLELASFDNPRSQRVRLEGPKVRLPSEVAVPFAMAIHELTANAAKYGALSQPEGRIDVTWGVRLDGYAQSLYLEWIERDGPVVHAPTHHGFGERLLKRMLTAQAQAEVRTEYRPEGLRFMVDLPLSR